MNEYSVFKKDSYYSTGWSESVKTLVKPPGNFFSKHEIISKNLISRCWLPISPRPCCSYLVDREKYIWHKM